MTSTPPLGALVVPVRPRIVGVNLKTYLGYRETLAWCRRVAAEAATVPDVRSGAIELFVLPALPLLVPVLASLRDTPVGIGAQDISVDPPGAATGEASAALVAEIGCRYALIGHAERRRRFGESDTIVARKVAIASRHGLRPIVCVGERHRVTTERAATLCIGQARRALIHQAGTADRPRAKVARYTGWKRCQPVVSGGTDRA